MKINKRLIVIIVAILIIIALAVVIIMNMNNKNDEDVSVGKDEVQDIYDGMDAPQCTDIGLLEGTVGDKATLYLIFSRLDSDGKLDSLTAEDYETASENILGDREAITSFTDYVYNGKAYTLNNGQISSKDADCGTREYVSKLFGYTYDNERNLDIQVNFGYVEDDKLYDLDGTYLGDYNEDDLKSLLDSGTMKTYKYDYQNNKYTFSEVTD